jgi:hypothetical protein
VVLVKLGARLSAGGGDPLVRPADALDFTPGVVFAHEDGLITRDAARSWRGRGPIRRSSCSRRRELRRARLQARLGAARAAEHRALPRRLAGRRRPPADDGRGGLARDARALLLHRHRGAARLADGLPGRVHGLRERAAAARPRARRRRALPALAGRGQPRRAVADRPALRLPAHGRGRAGRDHGVFYEWGLGTFASSYLHDLSRRRRPRDSSSHPTGAWRSSRDSSARCGSRRTTSSSSRTRRA